MVVILSRKKKKVLLLLLSCVSNYLLPQIKHLEVPSSTAPTPDGRIGAVRI